MKVNDFIKKVNYGSSKLPVFLKDGISGTPRKVDSFDFAGYPYDEKDRTITTIDLQADKIVVYYK